MPAKNSRLSKSDLLLILRSSIIWRTIIECRLISSLNAWIVETRPLTTPHDPACPQCGSTWREARYDYANLAILYLPNSLDVHLISGVIASCCLLQLQSRSFPGRRRHPLIRATNLGMMLGCPNLYIKDERQGPTHSFKDRQAGVTIAALKEAGVTELVVASTGNVAIAYSAYAARAGIKLWAFLTSLVPAAKMREVALYGTQVIKVTGSYDQAKQVAAEFARQRGIMLDIGCSQHPLR